MLVLRSDVGLSAVLKEIKKISEELFPRLIIENPKDLVETLELRNLLIVGEVVARAARMRQETRGTHFRVDFSERDDTNWLGVVTVKKGEKGPELERVIIDPDWKDQPGDMGEAPWG